MKFPIKRRNITYDYVPGYVKILQHRLSILTREKERKMLQIHVQYIKKKKEKDNRDVVYQDCQEVGKQFRKLTTVLNGRSEK